MYFVDYFQKCNTGEYYHVFSKSIAKFRIFSTPDEFARMLQAIQFYQINNVKESLSSFLKDKHKPHLMFQDSIAKYYGENERIVQVAAYCLMPTHVHLLIKQKREDGIESYMRNVLNSYTRYFNLLHNRKGPLWSGRFRRVFVESDEHWLYLSRYIHLNPVESNLVHQPEQWVYSSYKEYLREITIEKKVCDISDCPVPGPDDYQKYIWSASSPTS